MRSLLLSVPDAFVKDLEMHQGRKPHPCLHFATYNNRTTARMARGFEGEMRIAPLYFKGAVIYENSSKKENRDHDFGHCPYA